MGAGMGIQFGSRKLTHLIKRDGILTAFSFDYVDEPDEKKAIKGPATSGVDFTVYVCRVDGQTTFFVRSLEKSGLWLCDRLEELKPLGLTGLGSADRFAMIMFSRGIHTLPFEISKD